MFKKRKKHRKQLKQQQRQQVIARSAEEVEATEVLIQQVTLELAMAIILDAATEEELRVIHHPEMQTPERIRAVTESLKVKVAAITEKIAGTDFIRKGIQESLENPDSDIQSYVSKEDMEKLIQEIKKEEELKRHE